MSEAIEDALRPDNIGGGEIVVRGNPLTIEGVLAHAHRTAAIFRWRGGPLYAVSAAVTGPGRCVEDLLAGQALRTRSSYARATVRAVAAAGFTVLPTFSAPHVSIVLPAYDEECAAALLAVLGPVQQNPFRLRRTR